MTLSHDRPSREAVQQDEQLKLKQKALWSEGIDGVVPDRRKESIILYINPD